VVGAVGLLGLAFLAEARAAGRLDGDGGEGGIGVLFMEGKLGVGVRGGVGRAARSGGEGGAGICESSDCVRPVEEAVEEDAEEQEEAAWESRQKKWRSEVWVEHPPIVGDVLAHALQRSTSTYTAHVVRLYTIARGRCEIKSQHPRSHLRRKRRGGRRRGDAEGESMLGCRLPP